MAVLLRLVLSFLLLLVTQTSASESILDLINLQEVESVMLERRGDSAKVSATDHNLLEDEGSENDLGKTFRRNISSEDLVDLLSHQGEKFLRSSKDALLIAKKELLRKDWCKTEPLVQVVREEGCAPVSVLNHFCYGQCNSFYVPKSPIKRKGKAVRADFELAAFRSCPSCRPKRSSWVNVTMRCRRKKRTVLRRKRILRVKECKCLTEPLN